MVSRILLLSLVCAVAFLSRRSDVLIRSRMPGLVLCPGLALALCLRLVLVFVRDASMSYVRACLHTHAYLHLPTYTCAYASGAHTQPSLTCMHNAHATI